MLVRKTALDTKLIAQVLIELLENIVNEKKVINKDYLIHSIKELKEVVYFEQIIDK